MSFELPINRSILRDRMKRSGERIHRVHQTPLSLVPLTAGHAYKVLREAHPQIPLDEEETRRRILQAEMEKGRSVSPQAYLGVVPVDISLWPGRRSILGVFPFQEGRDWVWALKMKRMGRSFKDIYQKEGELPEKAVHTAVASLLQWRKGLAPHPEAAKYRGIVEFAAILDTDMEVVEGLLGSSALLTETSSLAGRVLTQLQPVWQERLVKGKIKDGHGDFKLANVFMPLNERTDEAFILDPIAFHLPWSVCDVLEEMATFASEIPLDDFQRGKSSESSLLAILQEEYGKVFPAEGPLGENPLFWYYLGYRKMVVAKIAAFENKEAESLRTVEEALICFRKSEKFMGS